MSYCPTQCKTLRCQSANISLSSEIYICERQFLFLFCHCLSQSCLASWSFCVFHINFLAQYKYDHTSFIRFLFKHLRLCGTKQQPLALLLFLLCLPTRSFPTAMWNVNEKRDWKHLVLWNYTLIKTFLWILYSTFVKSVLLDATIYYTLYLLRWM